MLLIGVRADSAHFMMLGKPQPVVLFEMLKARLTGEAAEMGETHELSGSRIRGRWAIRVPAGGVYFPP